MRMFLSEVTNNQVSDASWANMLYPSTPIFIHKQVQMLTLSYSYTNVKAVHVNLGFKM